MKVFDSMPREVAWAAKQLARNGIKGLVGDPLPDYMSTSACDWINDHQVIFRLRIHLLRAFVYHN